MPDLGRYATEVLTAYGVSIVALAALVWLSVRQARRVRRRLEDVEARRRAPG
ncbi:heme exporter protein CcmD [Rhodobacterales bacterium HKCCE2091]|nr:heme exporter protein CcmD [Rhodobacterales bacterium HKCCE2091]